MIDNHRGDGAEVLSKAFAPPRFRITRLTRAIERR
jgi:hypothetical protein